ncbi:MAG: acyltransferase family protein [Solirubrobacterales bacterium]
MGTPFIGALNGFRGYAILGVVVFHMLSLSSPPGEGFGVLTWVTFGGLLDVFFIVSGCGLFLPIVARGEFSVREFARKRAARLYPAYWLALTVTLGLALALSQPLPSLGVAALDYAALQWPAQLWDASATIGFGNRALWMISVVVGLYVLMAVFARPYLRHPLAGLAIAAAVTVAWKLAAVHETSLFEAVNTAEVSADVIRWVAVDQFPGWIFSFALGMSCAWAYVKLALPRPRAQLERLALRAAPAALLSLGVLSYLYADAAADADWVAGPAVARQDPLLGLAYTTSKAAVMAVIVLGPALLSRPFANRVADELAELSYGLYLIHYAIAVYLCGVVLDLPRTGSLADAALWLAVALPPSFAFAYLSARFVERPAQAWARRPRAGDGAGMARGPLSRLPDASLPSPRSAASR